MNIRIKDQASIRRDALSMAAKKRRSGCEPCADSYLKLAREHGATAADVANLGTEFRISASVAEPSTAQVATPASTDIAKVATTTSRSDKRRIAMRGAAAGLGSLAAAGRPPKTPALVPTS